MSSSLVALADGKEVARLGPGKVLERQAWALAVVELAVERDRRTVAGDMKATVTGRRGPALATLGPGARLHVFLQDADAPPALPALALPFIGAGILGGLALYVDDHPAAVTLLEARYAHEQPPPRAVAQVYCRWLRGGGLELGCEMRDFFAPAPGMKPPRLVSRWVEPASVITLAILGA